MWNTKLKSLDSRKGKWKFVIITGIFAFVFTNIFEPFGIYNSTNKSGFEIFLEINIALISVVGILALTQFVFRKIIGIKSFTYLTIVFWFLLDITLIGAVWTLLTVLIDGSNSTILNLWITNLIECFFLIGLPYFSTLIYLTYKEKTKTINKLQEEINKERISPDAIITFKESSEKEKLSLRLKDVLYLESSDNYVIIYYNSNGITEKKVLRNTIKKLEPELQPYNIIRCHRSFMVNPINIEKKEKSQRGFNLYIKGIAKITVPVSKSYISELDKILK